MQRTTRVLVADPSVYLADLTAGMLRSVGFQTVTTVNDSTAALAVLDRAQFDIMVVDDMLAPIDGVKLTRRIRALDNHNRLMPVIMVFAEATQRRIVEARDAGVTEFIGKPLSARILDARIAQAMDHPRPFVAAPDYSGPDRRRRSVTVGEDRRHGETES